MRCRLDLLDSRMPAFLQTHGADYANDIAELSMRFLSGLIDNGTRYSYELFDRILPGAVSSPMSIHRSSTRPTGATGSAG